MVAAMAVAAIGCGQDGSSDDAAATSTSAAPAATSSDDTTSTTEVRDVTTSAGATGVDSTASADEAPTFHPAGPAGSGCSPGAGALPDGWWFGERATPIGDELGFDLACYYEDAAAATEAASRDDEALGGFYIVNDNPAIRTVPVSSTATAQCLSTDGVLSGCDLAQINDGFRSIWIQVLDGEVVRVIEQLLP